VPTDLGRALPQVRGGAWRVAVWMECGPNWAGLRQQQAKVGRSDIGRAKSVGSAGLTEWLPIVRTPFLAHSPDPSVLRVHLRLIALPACARTCSRGKATREQLARKGDAGGCFQVDPALRASKQSLLEPYDARNTHPRPSPSACRPRGLAAVVQVPPALPCTGRLVGLPYREYAPLDSGGTHFWGNRTRRRNSCATCRHSTATCASARMREDGAQTF
jgi:hypothetical protein